MSDIALIDDQESEYEHVANQLEPWGYRVLWIPDEIRLNALLSQTPHPNLPPPPYVPGQALLDLDLGRENGGVAASIQFGQALLSSRNPNWPVIVRSQDLVDQRSLAVTLLAELAPSRQIQHLSKAARLMPQRVDPLHAAASDSLFSDRNASTMSTVQATDVYAESDTEAVPLGKFLFFDRQGRFPLFWSALRASGHGRAIGMAASRAGFTNKRSVVDRFAKLAMILNEYEADQLLVHELGGDTIFIADEVEAIVKRRTAAGATNVDNSYEIGQFVGRFRGVLCDTSVHEVFRQYYTAD